MIDSVVNKGLSILTIFWSQSEKVAWYKKVLRNPETTIVNNTLSVVEPLTFLPGLTEVTRPFKTRSNLMRQEKSLEITTPEVKRLYQNVSIRPIFADDLDLIVIHPKLITLSIQSVIASRSYFPRFLPSWVLPMSTIKGNREVSKNMSFTISISLDHNKSWQNCVSLLEENSTTGLSYCETIVQHCSSPTTSRRS